MSSPPVTVRHSVDLGELESHLWEAANILRGPVDAADFKTYVFPLLFFKRLSDVHDEEYDAALAESGGDEEYALFPQNYRFQVPKGCHWCDVRAVTTNVGHRWHDGGHDAVGRQIRGPRSRRAPQMARTITRASSNV